jgi:hypothetical protein
LGEATEALHDNEALPSPGDLKTLPAEDAAGPGRHIAETENE